MPKPPQPVAVVFALQSGATGAGAAAVQVLDSRDRWTRALKSGGLLAGLGVACLLIPLVHFVAPPLLWLFALVVFVRRLGEKRLIVSGGGSCPQCRAAISLEPGPARWPAETVCDGCRRRVTIRPISGVQAESA
jgi:hypothetical protein